MTVRKETEMRTAYMMMDGAFTEMRELSRKAARWANVDSESGVTAIEYGLIAAIMAAFLVTALATVTGGLTTAFDNIATALGVKN
jgi:pilus assembly protein Flp/PilA